MISIRVLLIDDQAALRDGLKMLLESAVKLLLARNGIVPENGIRA
jgi:DNA-binding NarL/FixJ family response regulator